MFAVLGEDRSDAETIVILIKRILRDDRATVRKKGFSGCGELRKKAAGQLRLFREKGASRFVICHDADGSDPGPVRRLLEQEAVVPREFREHCGIVIPVQELESWILADPHAVAQVIRQFKIPSSSSPEFVENPKEELLRLSRRGRTRPLYAPAVHNPKIAEHLDLKIVASKCPSFLPLRDFVDRAVA